MAANRRHKKRRDIKYDSKGTCLDTREVHSCNMILWSWATMSSTIQARCNRYPPMDRINHWKHTITTQRLFSAMSAMLLYDLTSIQSKTFFLDHSYRHSQCRRYVGPGYEQPGVPSLRQSSETPNPRSVYPFTSRLPAHRSTQHHHNPHIFPFLVTPPAPPQLTLRDMKFVLGRNLKAIC